MRIFVCFTSEWDRMFKFILPNTPGVISHMISGVINAYMCMYRKFALQENEHIYLSNSDIWIYDLIISHMVETKHTVVYDAFNMNITRKIACYNI